MTEKRIRLRTWFLGGAFTFLFFLLLVRLFWIQTVNADWLVQEAQSQWERNDILHPKRGTIYDRNGELLAYTAKAYTVIAKLKPWDKTDESYVVNALETAQKLAPILGMPAERIAKLIEDSRTANRSQVELRPGGWKINEDKAIKVSNLKLPGIILYPESKRYYPNDAFASHVIGYTDLDGKSVMGIERVFNDKLEGQEGELRVLKDRRGFKLPGGMEDFKPAKNGNNVYLTIDYQIQNYVEDALNNITQKYNTKGISVIVADPNTGEILAMSNRPHFSPNQYQKITNWTNYAISSTFEPGSTFKIVTLAAAIEEGVYRNNDTFMSGIYRKVPGQPIRDHNNGKGWGRISYLQGVQESSNVLFTILGYERLGKDKFLGYLEKFGFGQPTGVGLPGEASAEMKNKNQLYPRDVASMTFGQGVVVTAIQQVAAVSAIANGGELIQPYIVKEIRDSQTGEVLEEQDKKVVRRVVSEKTAKQVRDILETVVTDGTGSYFYLEGYHVAGKTGTAQVVGKDGKYKENKYIYSFIGFAPKDSPKFLVYVVIDQPDVPDSNFGGRDVAAPIFKHVMQNSLQYMKVSPDHDTKTVRIDKSESIPIPDLSGKTPVMVEQLLKQKKLQVKVVGTGSKVVGQYPKPGEKLMAEGVVYVLTDSLAEDYLPDFTGLTLREVMEYSSMLGIKLEVEGKGYVISQSIPPGTRVAKGQPLKIQLNPQSQLPLEQKSEDGSNLSSVDPVESSKDEEER